MTETKTQHTPGPWTLSNGVMIADDSLTLGASSGRPKAETEANMRLIAAAPELLKAAKMARRVLGELRGGPHEEPAILRALCEAIAKAEGR